MCLCVDLQAALSELVGDVARERRVVEVEYGALSQVDLLAHFRCLLDRRVEGGEDVDGMQQECAVVGDADGLGCGVCCFCVAQERKRGKVVKLGAKDATLLHALCGTQTRNNRVPITKPQGSTRVVRPSNKIKASRQRGVAVCLGKNVCAVDSGKCVGDVKAKSSEGVVCVGGGGLDDIDSDLGAAGGFGSRPIFKPPADQHVGSE